MICGRRNVIGHGQLSFVATRVRLQSWCGPALAAGPLRVVVSPVREPAFPDRTGDGAAGRDRLHIEHLAEPIANAPGRQPEAPWLAGGEGNTAKRVRADVSQRGGLDLADDAVGRR